MIRHLRKGIPVAGLFGVVFAFGCSEPPTTRQKERLSIFVTIPPQAFFVHRIGGQLVDVSILVPPGESPHTFAPKPKQMAKMSSAGAYLTIGIPFETRFVAKVHNLQPNLKIFDSAKGIPNWRTMPPETGGEKDEDHPAGARDPHIWLDPKNEKIIARNICDTLKEIDPEHTAEYEKNLTALEDDLDRVDRKIAEVLKPLAGKEFIVFHPAFGYFADAYHLRQVPIEVDGKDPGARWLATVTEEARKRGIRIIFVQPQFSKKSAEAVAREIGGAVVPIDPLAEDYLNNLETLADEIAKSLRQNP
jgi:zinc transport system substrate-binding protein